MKNYKSQNIKQKTINQADIPGKYDLVIKYLFTILFLFIPLVFFTDSTRNPYYIQGVSLNLIISIISILYITDACKKNNIILYKTQLNFSLYLYFVICLLSWGFAFFYEKKFWSVLLPENIKNFYDNKKIWTAILSEGTRNNLFLFTNAILIFITSLVYFNDRKKVDYIININFLSATISSIYGILQYFGIELIWPREINPFGYRCVSTFGNPNFFSSYLILLLPIGIYKIIFEDDSFKKFLYSVITSIIFTALICTATRSSWVGAFFEIIFILLFFYFTALRQKFQKIYKYGIMIFIIGFIIIWQSPARKDVKERLESIFDSSKRGLAGTQRMLIWKSSFDIFKDRPVLGVGYGLFELYYPFYQSKYLYKSNANLRTHANNSHNELLEQLNQVGLVGTGIYFLFFFTLYYFSIKKIIRLENLKDKGMMVALLASVTGMLIDNLLNVSIHFAMPAMIFWWIISLLILFGNNFNFEKINIELKNIFIKKIIIYPFYAIFLYIPFMQISYFFAEKNYFEGFKTVKRISGENINLVEKAIKKLTNAYKLHHYEVNNNYELGNSYARLKNIDKAIWAYSEAIAANPGYDEIYFNRGIMYLNKGDIETAIKDMKMSYQINPTSQEVLNNILSISMNNNKYTKDGIFVLEKTIERDPGDKNALTNLGILYSRLEKWEKAIESYEKALKIDPDNEPAKKNLLLAKERKEGRVMAVKTIDLSKFFSAAEKYIKEKNWQEAEKNYKEILKYSPSNLKALLYLGNISFEEKKLTEAVKYYQEVLKIIPNNSAAMTNLGLTYYELKQYKEAKEIFQNILKIDPQNQTAKNILNVIK